MTTAVKISPAEYLRLERAAAFESEYVAGKIIPEPGASREHNLLGSNIIRVLGNQLLEQPCEIYGSDMKVRTKERYSYPDVVVVYGEPRFEDMEVDVLLNPTVIFEILSPSREVFDRGEKFSAYRQRESLQVYILVSQHFPKIEMYQRQASGGWYFSEVMGLEATLSIPVIDCTLSLADVYRKIVFDKSESL
jgi:Uma2 family endonuclease